MTRATTKSHLVLELSNAREAEAGTKIAFYHGNGMAFNL